MRFRAIVVVLTILGGVSAIPTVQREHEKGVIGASTVKEKQFEIDAKTDAKQSDAQISEASVTTGKAQNDKLGMPTSIDDNNAAILNDSNDDISADAEVQSGAKKLSAKFSHASSEHVDAATKNETRLLADDLLADDKKYAPRTLADLEKPRESVLHGAFQDELHGASEAPPSEPSELYHDSQEAAPFEPYEHRGVHDHPKPTSLDEYLANGPEHTEGHVEPGGHLSQLLEPYWDSVLQEQIDDTISYDNMTHEFRSKYPPVWPEGLTSSRPGQLDQQLFDEIKSTYANDRDVDEGERAMIHEACRILDRNGQVDSASEYQTLRELGVALAAYFPGQRRIPDRARRLEEALNAIPLSMHGVQRFVPLPSKPMRAAMNLFTDQMKLPDKVGDIPGVGDVARNLLDMPATVVRGFYDFAELVKKAFVKPVDMMLDLASSDNKARGRQQCESQMNDDIRDGYYTCVEEGDKRMNVRIYNARDYPIEQLAGYPGMDGMPLEGERGLLNGPYKEVMESIRNDMGEMNFLMHFPVEEIIFHTCIKWEWVKEKKCIAEEIVERKVYTFSGPDWLADAFPTEVRTVDPFGASYDLIQHKLENLQHDGKRISCIMGSPCFRQYYTGSRRDIKRCKKHTYTEAGYLHKSMAGEVNEILKKGTVEFKPKVSCSFKKGINFDLNQDDFTPLAEFPGVQTWQDTRLAAKAYLGNFQYSCKNMEEAATKFIAKYDGEWWLEMIKVLHNLFKHALKAASFLAQEILKGLCGQKLIFAKHCSDLDGVSYGKESSPVKPVGHFNPFSKKRGECWTNVGFGHPRDSNGRHPPWGWVGTASDTTDDIKERCWAQASCLGVYRHVTHHQHQVYCSRKEGLCNVDGNGGHDITRAVYSSQFYHGWAKDFDNPTYRKCRRNSALTELSAVSSIAGYDCVPAQWKEKALLHLQARRAAAGTNNAARIADDKAARLARRPVCRDRDDDAANAAATELVAIGGEGGEEATEGYHMHVGTYARKLALVYSDGEPDAPPQMNMTVLLLELKRFSEEHSVDSYLERFGRELQVKAKEHHHRQAGTSSSAMRGVAHSTSEQVLLEPGSGDKSFGPFERLSLFVEPTISTAMRFEGTGPLTVEADPLEPLQKLFDDMGSYTIPIFPLLLSVEFELKPTISMPLKFQVELKGKGEVWLGAKPMVFEFPLIGNGGERMPAFDLSESYVDFTGSFQAAASVGLRVELLAEIKVCFLSFVCAGVGAEAKWEAAAGADFGITTANSDCDDDEYRLATEFTHFVEYAGKDLEVFDNAVAKAKTQSGRGLVAGMGLWYYVTHPAFTVNAFVEKGGGGPMDVCSLRQEHTLFDNKGDDVKQQVFRGKDSGDKLRKKQSDAEKAADTKWMHDLVDFEKSPFMLRDTLTHAMVLPTNQAAGETKIYLFGGSSSPPTNFGPLNVGSTVGLWSPHRKCFVRMREGWDVDKSFPRDDGTLPYYWRNERFRVVDATDANMFGGKCASGCVALWSPATKRFMSMRDSGRMGRSGVSDDGTLPGGWEWERFKVADGTSSSMFNGQCASGCVGLWSPRWKRFVRMPSSTFLDSSGPLDDGTLPSNWAWERFKVVKGD